MWTTGPFKKGKEYFFVFRKHFLSYSLRRPDKERVKKRVGHPSYLHSTVRTDVLMGPKWTKSIRCGHGIPSGMAQRLQFFCPFRILYGFSHYSFSVLSEFCMVSLITVRGGARNFCLEGPSCNTNIFIKTTPYTHINTHVFFIIYTHFFIW